MKCRTLSCWCAPAAGTKQPTPPMLLLVGLSLVLQNGALALLSSDTKALQSSLLYSKIELGDVIVGTPMLIAFAVSILVTLTLYWQLRFTELGRMIRAAALDRGAAELMGINVNRVNMLAFGIGVGCLGIAPLMIGPGIKRAQIDCAIATRKLASMEPTKLPNPPRTTTTNAIKMKKVSMSGTSNRPASSVH
jgi:branched-subunit amino acid ABC-type transport system permease component